MTTRLHTLSLLLLAVTLLVAPAVASDVEISVVLSEVLIQPDSSLRDIDYNANGQENATRIMVFPDTDVVIFSNEIPAGSTLKAIVKYEDELVGEFAGNPLTISGIISSHEGMSINVSLSLIAPSNDDSKGESDDGSTSPSTTPTPSDTPTQTPTPTPTATVPETPTATPTENQPQATESAVVIMGTGSSFERHEIVTGVGYSATVPLGQTTVTTESSYTGTAFPVVPGKTAGVKDAPVLSMTPAGIEGAGDGSGIVTGVVGGTTGAGDGAQTKPTETETPGAGAGTGTDGKPDTGDGGKPDDFADGKRFSFWEIFHIDARLVGGTVAEISFKVQLSELEHHGHTYKDVILYHGKVEDGEWIPLDTHLTGIRDGYAHYTAKTDGASPFGILFHEDMTILPDDHDEEAVASGNWTTATGSGVQTPGFGAVTVLAGLGALLALRRTRQK